MFADDATAHDSSKCNQPITYLKLGIIKTKVALVGSRQAEIE